jgi:hypothetical protein
MREMPYPHEHAARLAEPSEFKEGSFRTIHPKPGVNVIIGKKKGEKKTSAQAIRYKKGKVPVSKARASAKKHHAISFTPAKKTKDASESAMDTSKKVERDVLEFMRQDKPCKVDAEKGIIYGVHLCGFQSKNGGTYPKTALEAALGMYEGTKCNINHPDRDNPGKDRRVEDRFGVYHNPTMGTDGVYADLHYLKEHPLASVVCEAAERMPEALGFSQNARSVQVPDGEGGIIHESITRVRSVDLVADPATTGSIFESLNDPHTQGMADMPPGESGDIVPEQEEPVEEPGEESSGADPLDVALDAIEKQYLPRIRDKSLESGERRRLASEMIKKIDGMCRLLASGPEESEEPLEEEPSESEEEETTQESEQEFESMATKTPEKPTKTPDNAPPPKPDYEQALDVLESVRVLPTAIRIKALLAVPTADRKALAESWPKMGEAASSVKPKSSSVMESYKTDEGSKSVFPTLDQLKDDALLLMSAPR